MLILVICVLLGGLILILITLNSIQNFEIDFKSGTYNLRHFGDLILFYKPSDGFKAVKRCKFNNYSKTIKENKTIFITCQYKTEQEWLDAAVNYAKEKNCCRIDYCDVTERYFTIWEKE